MPATSREPDDSDPTSHQRAWDELVSSLGEDVFAGVPDIIATPATAAPADSVHDGVELADRDSGDSWSVDDFVPPSPGRLRFSRRVRIAIGVLAAGPVIGWLAVILGILIGSAATIVAVVVTAVGLAMLVLALADRPTSDDGSGTY